MALVCIFSSASGRILFLDPHLAELAIGADAKRGSRASDIVEELRDPSPRRFFARLRFGEGALYEVTVRRLPAGPLVPSGALEATLVPAGERADPALDLFGTLWALNEGERSPSRVPETLATILRAFDARAAALGVRDGDGFRVEAVASAGVWPRPGARLALGLGRRGFEYHDLEPGSGGTAEGLWLAFDAARARPRWIGEDELAAVFESLAFARARERSPAPQPQGDFARERGAAEAAILAAAGDACAIEFALTGAGAIENHFGAAAACAALDELEARLRTLLRRGESLFRIAQERFFVIVPEARPSDEVLGLTRRIDGIVRFPIIVADRRFALATRFAMGALSDEAFSLEAAIASLHPLEDAQRAVSRGSGGFLACFDPIVALDGSGVGGAELLVRRVDPTYGVLAAERIGTVAATEAERLAIASWLVDEAASVLDGARPRGLRELSVNICALAPRSVEILVDSERFGEYRMKGLRFELTAQQLESVTANDTRAHVAGSFAVAMMPAFASSVATIRRHARAVGDVVLEGSLVDEAASNPRTRAALLAATSDFARSLGLRTRVRGPHMALREDRLRRLGAGAIQNGTDFLTLRELLRLTRARASGGTA